MTTTKAYFWNEIVWSGQPMEEKQWLRDYRTQTYCRPDRRETRTQSRTARILRCLKWQRALARSQRLTFIAAQTRFLSALIEIITPQTCVWPSTHGLFWIDQIWHYSDGCSTSISTNDIQWKTNNRIGSKVDREIDKAFQRCSCRINVIINWTMDKNI